RVGSGSERGAPARSCEGHAAAGEAGAANVEALGQPSCVTPARAGSALKRSRSGTFAAPVLTTRDLVSGRKRKRAWGACWVVRRSCRGGLTANAFSLRYGCRAGFDDSTPCLGSEPEASVGRLLGRAKVMPRPAKPARQTSRPWAAIMRHARTRSAQR